MLNDVFKARIDLTFNGLDLKKELFFYTRHMPQLTQNMDYRKLFET